MGDGTRPRSKQGSSRRSRDLRGESPASERDGSQSGTTVGEIYKIALHAGSRNGIVAMFAGPSGTGKTMAAGLLASETGPDVYRVDLSQVVSKYIGETEKNLSALFVKASQKGWILFFDEADALFGKRTEAKDAHHSHSNIEVSYLADLATQHKVTAVLMVRDPKRIDVGESHNVVLVEESG